MSDPRFLLFSTLGVLAGAILAIQSVLNAALAQRAGILPSLVVLALIGTSTLLLRLPLFASQIAPEPCLARPIGTCISVGSSEW